MSTSAATLNDTVTLRQAYLVMFAYLDNYWHLSGKPLDSELATILSELSLWETVSGNREPMDAAIFEDWLDCASMVMDAERNQGGYSGADIIFQDGRPRIKVLR